MPAGLRSNLTDVGRCHARVTIDMLPEVPLLGIFDSYVGEVRVDAWYTLVHVCRKWRNIVFGSPRRLNLRLLCKGSTPVRKTLNVWPLLPIVVRDDVGVWGVENIAAALEHSDRICQVDIRDCQSWLFGKAVVELYQPLPALTHLLLRNNRDIYEMAPRINSNLFLDGSAPQLQTLVLEYISFRRLPKLLLTATHLVDLDLRRIPHSGYISPEAMVTCLSVLTSLKSLVIEFQSPQSRPDWKHRRPLSQTRTLLPVLTKLRFFGADEYLEDLVARVDAPLLDKLTITFFHQLSFDTPQLTQFISRSPNFKAHNEARLTLSNWEVSVTFPQTSVSGRALNLTILCGQSDQQLLSLAQVCSLSFPRALIHTVEHLYILGNGPWYPQGVIESSQWLELFHPFTAVKDLCTTSDFVVHILPALQELVGERVAEVLPSLQTLFLERILPWTPVHWQEIVEQFVAARQLANHPIAVSRWEKRN